MGNPVQKGSHRDFWQCGQYGQRNAQLLNDQENLKQRLESMNTTFQVLPLAQNGNWPSQPPKKCCCPKPGQDEVNTCYDTPCQCNVPTETPRTINYNPTPIKNEINVQNIILNNCTCDTCPLGDVPYDVPCQCNKQIEVPQPIQNNDHYNPKPVKDEVNQVNVPTTEKKCGCPNSGNDEVNVQTGNLNACTCDTCPLGDVPYDVPCQCNKQTEVSRPISKSDNYNPKPVKDEVNARKTDKRCGCPNAENDEVNVSTGNLNSCTCDTCPLGDVPYEVPCQCDKRTEVPRSIQKNDNYNPKPVKDEVNMRGTDKKCGCPNSVNDEVNAQTGKIKSCTCDTCPLGDVPYDVPCQCIKRTELSRPIQNKDNSDQNRTTGYNVQPGNLNNCTCDTCPLGDVPYDVPCQCDKRTVAPQAAQQNYKPTQNRIGDLNSCICDTCPLSDVPYDTPCQCIKSTEVPRPLQKNDNYNPKPVKDEVTIGRPDKKCSCPNAVKNEVNVQRQDEKCSCPNATKDEVNVLAENLNTCECNKHLLSITSHKGPCHCSKPSKGPQPIQKNDNSAKVGTTNYNPKPVKEEVNIRNKDKKCSCANAVKDKVNVKTENLTNCKCGTCPLGDVPYGISCECNKSPEVPQPIQKKYNSGPDNKRKLMKDQVNIQNKNLKSCKCETCPLADLRCEDPCQCGGEPIQSITSPDSVEDKVNMQNNNLNICKCENCPLDSSTCPCTQPQEDNRRIINEKLTTCKCETCYLDSSTCPCNQQDDNKSCSCQSESSSLPDNISVGKDDVAYVQKIRQLLENENKLNKEMDDLDRTEKCYDKRIQGRRAYLSSSGSGDYEIQNLKRLNEKLEESNNILEAEIEETIANIKHLKENVEEPIRREIEAEKKKIRDLEESFRHKQGGSDFKRMAKEKEIEFVHNQLQHANQYLSDLNMVNKRLKEELCMLNCRCNELQTDIINQKLSEIHTVSRLYAQKRRVADHTPSKHSKGSCDDGDSGGGSSPRRRRSSSRSSSLSCSCKSPSDTNVCPKERSCPSKQGQNDLDVIAQNLSTLLAQTSECNNCQCTNTDLIDTVKYIKNLVDMVNAPDPGRTTSNESLPYCECDDMAKCLEPEIEMPTKDVQPPLARSDDEGIVCQKLLYLLLNYLDVQFDEMGQIIVDEEGRPITADGTPIDINVDELGLQIDAKGECTCHAQGQEEEKDRQRICSGPPCLKKMTPLQDVVALTSDGRHVNVLMGDDGKPVIDETGNLLDVDGHPIPSDAVLTAAGPIAGKEARPVSPEKKPILETPIQQLCECVEVQVTTPPSECKEVQVVEDLKSECDCEPEQAAELIKVDASTDDDGQPVLETPVLKPCVCDAEVTTECPEGTEMTKDTESLPVDASPEVTEDAELLPVDASAVDDAIPILDTSVQKPCECDAEFATKLPEGAEVTEDAELLLVTPVQKTCECDGVLSTELPEDAEVTGDVELLPMTPIQKTCECDAELAAELPEDAEVTGDAEADKPPSEIVDDEGKLVEETLLDEIAPGDGLPVDIILDAQDLAPVEPEIEMLIDEQGHPLDETGKPISDIMLDDEEKPILDEDGMPDVLGALDETEVQITCHPIPRPPCEIVDEAILPLPEEEELTSLVPTPDEESVKIISRSTEGDYVTTATASGSELRVTTEGPVGVIDTTVKMTDSGNVQVHTDITEFGDEQLADEHIIDEQIVDEQSLVPTDVTSEVTTEESAHTEIDEGAEGDVAREYGTDEESTEIESEVSAEEAHEVTSDEGTGLESPMESTADTPAPETELLPLCQCEMEELADKVETLMPPIPDMEESKETLGTEEVKPCVCKSDKACQCTATGDQGCQCEEDEEKIGDDVSDDAGDVQICKPDICTSGERGGDVPWTCECMKAKNTLCEECSNKPSSDEKGSRIQVDVKITCDPPCKVIKSTTRYMDSDSSGSDNGNSDNNLPITKSIPNDVIEKSSTPGGCTCEDIGIQQNYYDLEETTPNLSKSGCNKATCPELNVKDNSSSTNKGIITFKDKKVDPMMENKVKLAMNAHSAETDRTGGRPNPCCPCSKETSTMDIRSQESSQSRRIVSSKSCSCRIKGSSGKSTVGNTFPNRAAVSNYTQPICDVATCPLRNQVSRETEHSVPGDRDKRSTCTCQGPCCPYTVNTAVSPMNIKCGKTETSIPCPNRTGSSAKQESSKGMGSLCCRKSKRTTPLAGDSGQRSLVSSSSMNQCACKIDSTATALTSTQKISSGRGSLKFDLSSRNSCSKGSSFYCPCIGNEPFNRESSRYGGGVSPVIECTCSDGSTTYNSPQQECSNCKCACDAEGDGENQSFSGIKCSTGDCCLCSDQSSAIRSVDLGKFQGSESILEDPSCTSSTCEDKDKNNMDKHSPDTSSQCLKSCTCMPESVSTMGSFDRESRLCKPSFECLPDCIKEICNMRDASVMTPSRSEAAGGDETDQAIDASCTPKSCKKMRSAPAQRSCTLATCRRRRGLPGEGEAREPVGPIVLGEDGLPIDASGKPLNIMLDENGNPILDEEGNMLTPSGHVISTDAGGLPVSADGRPIGVMLDENGQPLLDAEGNMLTPSGHVLPAGVQLDENGNPILDAEGHMLTPSGHVLPAGVQLDENGNPILDADGHMLTPSGHVLPADIQLDESGMPIQDAEGQMLTPSGQALPAGVQLDENGNPILDAEGHLLSPSGHVLPDGTQLDESGKPMLDAEGNMLTASGQVLPAGVQMDASGQPILDAEGHVLSPSGHVLPDGTQLDESGKPMLDAEGNMLTGSGQVLPAGVQLDESGQPILDAEGHMLSPSGHVLPDNIQLDASGKPMLDAEGQMLTASGQVLPAGVQLDASGQPIVDAEGHMLTASGHVLPDGIQLDASGKPLLGGEGQMVTATGQIIPAGVQLDASGKPMLDAEGHMLTASGHVLPAGIQMDASGKPIVDAEGQMLTATGQVLPPGVQMDASGKPIVDAEGNMLTASGHVIPPGVQVDASGKPIVDAEGQMLTATGQVLPPGVQMDASGKPIVDAEGNMLTASGHVIPPGVQVDASGKPIVDAEGQMLTATGQVLPPGVQMDESGKPMVDEQGNMLTADGTPITGQDQAELYNQLGVQLDENGLPILGEDGRPLGPDGMPIDIPGEIPQVRSSKIPVPFGCKCQKCNVTICECTEPVCETTEKHPPNCVCIDCICDPSKFDKSNIGDAAHPPDCACVDCLCDPKKGFEKSSELGGANVPCDCTECVCTPCADKTKAFVCPSFLPPHHPDCTCAQCLCEECLHIPGCDCEQCICAKCAFYNIPKNQCTCPSCACAPCGDTEKTKQESDRQDAGDKLFEQYLVDGDKPIGLGDIPMDQDDVSKEGGTAKQFDEKGSPIPPSGAQNRRHPDCVCPADCDCEKCLDVPACECEDFLCENCADEEMNRKKREFEAQHTPECDCPQCKCNPCRDKSVGGIACDCDETFTCDDCLAKKAIICDCDDNNTCDNCLYKETKHQKSEMTEISPDTPVESQHPVDCNCESCKCNPCVDDVIEAQKKAKAMLCDCKSGAQDEGTCDCWFCMCKKCKDPKIRAITNAPISSIFTNWDQVDMPDLSPLKNALKKSTTEHPKGCQCHDCSCDPCKLDPFRSSLNTGHGPNCTCSACCPSTCKGKDGGKKEHPKECNCDKCVCDPCEDPIFRTKRTLEKLKKDMPEQHGPDCDCPVCICSPCKDPKHGPGCKCPECSCEPCPKSDTSNPIDRHGQSCTCPICAPVSPQHGADCDCPQCVCKPCPDVNAESTKSLDNKHGPTCQCPICGPLAVNHGKGCKCPVCCKMKKKDKSKHSKHKSKSKDKPSSAKNSRPCKCVGACCCDNPKKKERSKSEDDSRRKKKSRDKIRQDAGSSRENVDRKKEIEELEALMEQIRCSCDNAEVEAACHYSGTPPPPPCPLKILDLQNSLRSLQEKCETKDKIIQEMQSKLQGKPDAGSVNAMPCPPPAPGPCGICAPTAAVVTIKEVKRISSESVLVKWTQPCNNLVIGYEISVNNTLRSRVHSAQRNSAVVFGVNCPKATILVHAITHYGRCEPPASYDFES